MRRTRLLPLLSITLAACSLARDRPGDIVPATARPWRTVATNDDRERLRDWRDSFSDALDKAGKAGAGDKIRREGALLAPDAALPNVVPPRGAYRCRRIKVGAQDPQQPAFFAYPTVPCRISATGNEPMLFETLSGPLRPGGRLFPESNQRLVFLGTLQIGDERGNLRYGSDLQRDTAGFLERIGERRWRLILPDPHFESLLDVVELIPAT